MIGFGIDGPGESKARGLAALGIDLSTARIQRDAQRSVNRTAKWARTHGAKLIRQQTAFPAAYLQPAAENLVVSRQAFGDGLEAAVTGRFRPTQLSRFVKGARVGGRRSPTVEVKPGRRETMQRAFLLNQRGGNVGLAIRLRPGERITGKKVSPFERKNGLAFLYGPSVNQIFMQVSEDMEDETLAYLEVEFLRLQGMDLL